MTVDRDERPARRPCAARVELLDQHLSFGPGTLDHGRLAEREAVAWRRAHRCEQSLLQRIGLRGRGNPEQQRAADNPSDQRAAHSL